MPRWSMKNRKWPDDPEEAESSHGELAFRTFRPLLTFTSVAGWLETEGRLAEEIVREFYASYAATLRGSISKRSKPLAQDPLTSTLVRGCPVDISPATIRRFLYGPMRGHSWSLNLEFDYGWDIVRSGAFGGITAARGCDTLVGHILLCGWRSENGSLLPPTFGHPEGDINFCGQVLTVLECVMGVDKSR
ncbi:hypothetical protein H5410_001775 [Solanum commersonii]|uniref:Uncharacterized protein n=1 Tax=Solanum commersonii TaxID=4109 RepID=A0A9J6B0I3_SOLCO|nr:hypothetical protein H5410_001775 [Solanum commersonii]